MDTYNTREAVENAIALRPALFSGIDNHNQECFSKLLGDYDAATGTMGVKQYEGGQDELDKVLASLLINKKELEPALPPVMEKLEEAYKLLEEVRNHKAIGGALVLVDLAWADYDKRDVGVDTTARS